MDSEVQWQCVLAVSASVCPEPLVCVSVCFVPGVTHPTPPGTQVVMLIPSPLEPPVDLGGHLGEVNRH